MCKPSKRWMIPTARGQTLGNRLNIKRGWYLVVTTVCTPSSYKYTVISMFCQYSRLSLISLLFSYSLTKGRLDMFIKGCGCGIIFGICVANAIRELMGPSLEGKDSKPHAHLRCRCTSHSLDSTKTNSSPTTSPQTWLLYSVSKYSSSPVHILSNL